MCDAGGRRVRLNLAHTSEQSTTSDGTHICVQIAEPPFSGGRWLEFGSRLDAPVEFELIDQPGVQRKLLKGDRPAVPVGAVRLGRDRGYQLLPERLAVAVEAGFDDGGAQAENPGLPRGLEDELTVAAWRGHGPLDIQEVCLHSRATPIIESRVTTSASSASDSPSMPAGLSGTTR